MLNSAEFSGLFFILLIGAGLIPLAIALVRLPSNGIKWSFVSFMTSSLIWIGLLWLIRGLDSDLAFWVSRTIFAANQIAVLSIVLLTAFIVRRPEVLQSPLLWLVVLFNLANIILALTGMIAIGLSPEKPYNAPIYGPLHIVYLACNLISVLYIGFILFQSIRKAEERSDHAFQLKYFSAITLSVGVAVIISNGILPANGIRDFVFMGPLAFIVVYWGFLRLMLFGRKIFMQHLFKRVAAKGFLNNNNNFAQMQSLMLAMEKMLSPALNPESRILVLDGGNSLNMHFSFMPLGAGQIHPGDPGMIQRMQNTINRLYRENLDYALRLESLEEEQKFREPEFKQFQASGKKGTGLVPIARSAVTALPHYSNEELAVHTRSIHQQLGPGPYQLGQLLQFMDIEPIECMLDAGQLHVIATDTFDFPANLPIPA